MSAPPRDAEPVTPAPAEDAARPRPAHPLQEAINEAVMRLAGFKAARIVGEPDAHDPHNLADDLMALAAIMDRVFAGYGDYARSTLGCGVPLFMFQDVCRGALEGDAVFVLRQIADRLRDGRAEAAAERRMELRRG